jgi:two-component system sensor histidine kinase KdpD
MEQKELDSETVMSLASDIRLDAQWLIRMVENILTITRISGDNLKVQKTQEAAEEVVFETVAIIRKRFPNHVIHTRIPDDLLMVEMDGTLISQVMINLLENAAKNSAEGSMIFVNLEKKDGFAVFEILDEGSGIPEHLLDTLFEVRPTWGDQPPSAAQGMGLGLSICKTIVQAHGGTIEGRNRIKKGAKFSFRLPLQGAADSDE